ncbi:MAG: DNA polymerase IV, partial [Mycobacterium sp.]
RTVTVKLKKSDMGILTRSATLAYATTDAAALITAAQRLLLDPMQIGPVRLLGVGFSGLTEVRQEPLFSEQVPVPEAAQTDQPAEISPPPPDAADWQVGDDVAHPVLGHGWVQGAGHGVVTARFETRGTGPGRARTFPVDTPEVTAADPIDSLDWADYLARVRADPEAD